MLPSASKIRPPIGFAPSVEGEKLRNTVSVVPDTWNSVPALPAPPPVRPAAKVQQHALRARRIHLPHNSSVATATISCSAIEIARRIHGRVSVGMAPVGTAASKAVQHSLDVARVQLEYRAVAGRAA